MTDPGSGSRDRREVEPSETSDRPPGERSEPGGRERDRTPRRGGSGGGDSSGRWGDEDAEGDGTADGAAGPAFDGGEDLVPEDMNLEELRQEIEDIDRELVELIARRTYVADTIADVKAEQGLPTTDESQEAAVMERAGTNAERFDVDANLVKAIFRLLIELNKVEQRERR